MVLLKLATGSAVAVDGARSSQVDGDGPGVALLPMGGRHSLVGFQVCLDEKRARRGGVWPWKTDDLSCAGIDCLLKASARWMINLIGVGRHLGARRQTSRWRLRL